MCGTDSSVVRMSEVKGQPPSEVVEDDVMNHLPTLDRVELVDICKVIGLDVPDDVSGSRGAVLKLLMRHLCTPSDEDDKLTAFLQIHTHLTLGKDDEEGDSGDDVAVVKAEPVVADVATATEPSLKGGDVSKESKGRPKTETQGQKPNVQRKGREKDESSMSKRKGWE